MFQERSIHKSLQLVLLITVTAGVMLSLQLSYPRMQQDDYFHIRYAQLMRSHGIYREFPWLKHTILNENFYDKHFLYHVLLIPFTFGNLIVMGKIASVCFAVALGYLFYWFLGKYGVKYRLIWTFLFLFGSKSLMVRLLAVRPIPFAIGFFILGVHFILRKKWLWLGFINYLFVLTYSAFIVFLVIAAVYTLVHLYHFKKFEYRPLVSTLVGMAAGITINPYFPGNLRVLGAQYLKTSLVRTNLEINLEWMPLSSWNLLLAVWPFIIVVTALFFMELRYGKKQHSFLTLFLFVQAVVFLLSYFKVSRGIDQFAPFVVLFCSMAFSEADFRPHRLLVISMIVLTAAALSLNYLEVEKALDINGIIDNSGSGEWLNTRAKKNDHVFIANYGAFPQLFFYSRNTTYTLGLDPGYMQAHDARLYGLYQDAVRLRKDPYPIIHEVFQADYVHVENMPRHARLYDYLSSNPLGFYKVYEDEFSALFKVR